MHPAKPLGGYLRAVIVHVNVVRVLNPSIAAIEIVRILVISITIFIGTD